MTTALDKKIKTQRTELAGAVFHHRTEAGWTQQALADFAGVDRKTVNRIECGHFSPNIDTLVRLGDALDMDAYELLWDQEYKTDKRK